MVQKQTAEHYFENLCLSQELAKKDAQTAKPSSDQAINHLQIFINPSKN